MVAGNLKSAKKKKKKDNGILKGHKDQLKEF